MKILGIDDNFAVNELLDTVLNGSGHNFRYVDNGQEGLKLIRAQKFDIILLDLTMPEFSGIDVIHTLKKENIIDKQKIIVFTALSNIKQNIKKLTELGVDSYIEKPIDIDALLEKIDRFG